MEFAVGSSLAYNVCHGVCFVLSRIEFGLFEHNLVGKAIGLDCGNSAAMYTLYAVVRANQAGKFFRYVVLILNTFITQCGKHALQCIGALGMGLTTD